MDLELEKLLAKVSGENVGDFACRAVSDAEKTQIQFAFEQIFSGLSLMYWMAGGTLNVAWKQALGAMRDFIFSLSGNEYIVDYLRIAVFDYKKKTLKSLESSVHANECFQYSSNKSVELKKSAEEKIKNGIKIIMDVLAEPQKPTEQQKKVYKSTHVFQKFMERERDNERERK